VSTGRSQVSFSNSYGKEIFVAYMFRDFGCKDCGDIWDVRGWIKLEPGETKSRDNPTENRWYYYYAEASDGAFWAGPFVAEVSNAKFEKCTCLGVITSDGTSPYHDAGFRELDNQEFSGVNFVP
jgi:uncharacterized membrane protein